MNYKNTGNLGVIELDEFVKKYFPNGRARLFPSSEPEKLVPFIPFIPYAFEKLHENFKGNRKNSVNPDKYNSHLMFIYDKGKLTLTFPDAVNILHNFIDNIEKKSNKTDVENEYISKFNTYFSDGKNNDLKDETDLRKEFSYFVYLMPTINEEVFIKSLNEYFETRIIEETSYYDM